MPVLRPSFLVGAPNSGQAALQATLAGLPGVWTIGDPQAVTLPGLHPSNRGWDGDRLTATDSGPEVADRVNAGLVRAARDRNGEAPPAGATGLPLIDAAARNALRLPFLAATCPGARFVFVHREPRETLAAMHAAWRGGESISYPELPGWTGPPWSLPLTPEWRSLAERPLPEIVAAQWSMTVRILLADLERLPADRWSLVDHAALAADPRAETERICAWLGITLEDGVTVAGIDDGSFDDHDLAAVEPVLASLAEVAARARDWIAGPAESPDGSPPAAAPNAFRSVSTANLAPILAELGCSLLTTTYQSGRLVCIRRTEDGLNTHFRGFESPMGLARRGGRLAVGTRSQVFEYHDVPQVAAKIDPPGSHDACFIPRRSHYTGDVRIHEIAYAAEELWIVATRFSCLATLDGDHSFVPRWKPPFVTALAAEDRCHLNGLAVVGGEPRFVTALGRTDVAGGWREGKADGGVLIDVPSSEIIATGLSMPHSPRWYRDQLWVLESGEGSLARIDLDTGAAETVCEFPGFTRGLAFAGPLAFVGLSEVRESATFGGLPITGRLEERQCGVWVVNIETAQVVAFLRFVGSVQEIFAIELLPKRFPEIAEHGSDVVNLSYVLPDEALTEVPRVG